MSRAQPAEADLAAAVRRSVLEEEALRRGEPVVVAVSGGLDSMVLLDVLRRLRPEFRWRLIVAHYNHGLRGAESDADERLVKATSRRRRLSLVVGRGDVRAFARQQRVSLEAAARTLRHRFFAETAIRHGADRVVLAHHRGDQAETFFLRLLRGAGPDGLGGMRLKGPSPADPRVTLVRPLLGIPRADILAYAVSARIEYREDASNREVEALRNRIRHRLLPSLVREFQPAIEAVVSRSMEILRAESDWLAGEAQRWVRGGEGAADFGALPLALQRRVLRLQLRAGATESRDGVQWFGLVERLRREPGVEVSVGPGVTVSRDAAGRLRWRRAVPAGFRSDRLAIRMQGRAGEVRFGRLEIRWRIERRAVPAPGRVEPGGNCERFDAGRVGRQLLLRHWQAGDRYWPIGLGQPAKLQDLFVNLKIPRSLRRELVVACTADGEPFWVEGLRVSERVKLGPDTARVLVWQWQVVEPARDVASLGGPC